jgi:hypothetical protein
MPPIQVGFLTKRWQTWKTGPNAYNFTWEARRAKARVPNITEIMQSAFVIGPRTEIKVSASVLVTIFGSILWGNCPALIGSGSGWCASENDRTAEFLNAVRPPETLTHSPSGQKLQNISKHQKLLIHPFQYRKSIPTHRTPATKTERLLDLQLTTV